MLSGYKNMSRKMAKFLVGLSPLEALIVLSTILALVVTIIASLRPYQIMSKSLVTQSGSEEEMIMSAIRSYQAEHNGSLPAGLTSPMTETQIGTATSGCEVATGGCASQQEACVNLAPVLSSALQSETQDSPVMSQLSASQSGYTVTIDAQNGITIKKCDGT